MSGTQKTPTTRRDPECGGAAPTRTPTPLPIPSPTEAYERYEEIFKDVQAPFAFLDLDAVWSNAADMLRRAHGKPIRIASKSVRCRPVLERLLDLDRGLPGGPRASPCPRRCGCGSRACATSSLAYPTADGACLTRLARLTAERPRRGAGGDGRLGRAPGPDRGVRGLVRGADPGRDRHRRLLVAAGRHASRSAPSARRCGPPSRPRHWRARSSGASGIRLVGLMAYEGQIAGVGDDGPRQGDHQPPDRAMQSASAKDVRERRAEMVTAVSEVAQLEFVNGGGTGSIEQTAAEWAVTEVAAGSGFYAPILFDHYRAFDAEPGRDVRAAGRAASRLPGWRPRWAAATWPPAWAPRTGCPSPTCPPGLRLDPLEGAGEVQTPLRGSAAERLSDRRSGLLPAHQGGRALRAIQHASTW